MPDTTTLDDRSEKKLKKLTTGEIASFYFACDSSLKTAGLVVRKTPALGKDTTRGLGSTLRKTLKVNKFCRGMVLKPTDSSGLTFISYGGNIPAARLQKFFRLQLAPEYSTVRSRLKAADVLSQSFLKKASSDQLVNLGLPGFGSTVPAASDDTTASDDTAPDVGGDLAADIRAEHQEIIDEAEAAWQAARGTPAEAEAARQLAEALSSGDELFPVEGESRDTALMAELYSHLIDSWSMISAGEPRSLFGSSDTRKDLRQCPLMYRGATWRVLCARTFTPGMTWADDYSDSIALLQYTGEQSDTLEDLIETTQEALGKAQEKIEARRRDIGDVGAMEGYLTTIAGLATTLDETVREVLNILIVRDPTPTLSDAQLDEFSALLHDATRLGNSLSLEAEFAQKEREEIPPPPPLDGPLPEYDGPEFEPPESTDLRMKLEDLQATCIKKLVKVGGKFKINLAPGIYPDLIREKSFPFPRIKSISKSLKELGYSDNITGSFVLQAEAMMGSRVKTGVFFFDLDTQDASVARRIRTLIKRYGGKAYYLPNGAQKTLAGLDGITDPAEHKEVVVAMKSTEGAVLFGDRKDKLSARRAELIEADEALPKGLRPLKTAYHDITLTLLDPSYRDDLIDQCELEFSRENPAFAVATIPQLSSLRPLFPELMPMVALTNADRTRWLFEQFVVAGAPMEINLSGGTRARLIERAKAGILSPSVSREYFDAGLEVLKVIKDTLSRMERVD